MAELLAEQKLHGLEWRFEEDIIKELVTVRATPNIAIFVTDLRAIALALLDDDPPISLSGARRALTYCRNETHALLDQPRMWGGVERVAKALN